MASAPFGSAGASFGSAPFGSASVTAPASAPAPAAASVARGSTVSFVPIDAESPEPIKPQIKFTGTWCRVASAKDFVSFDTRELYNVEGQVSNGGWVIRFYFKTAPQPKHAYGYNEPCMMLMMQLGNVSRDVAIGLCDEIMAFISPRPAAVNNYGFGAPVASSLFGARPANDAVSVPSNRLFAC